ncbi:YolD-like family protein [Brevibacillus brevis]|uniref:YolD-like family protein n=1 Tax=Brevibacillus brevis TaxID=1393 RepID=UPI00165E6BB3|nr:YolD-like family protein [Brevibacillus brevis]
MTLLYEHHYEEVVVPLPEVDPDSLAEMNVIIYDSVRKDYAINVSWHEDCIRGEWGVVKDIDRIENKIKLVRVDGVWWVPLEKMLQVERV